MRHTYLLITFSTLLTIILLSACNLTAPTPVPLPTPITQPTTLPTIAAPEPTTLPTVAPPEPTTPPAPEPSSTPTPIIPDTGWQLLQPALEQRIIRLLDEQAQQIEELTILRLEPSQFIFDVGYDSQGKSLEAWQAQSNALLVVNGGFYREENEQLLPAGLIIVDGEPNGWSYGEFAGMLAISETSTELRWLAESPYNPNEPLRAGLQSFPMLIKPGGVLGFAQEHEDNKQARRTVIAQDNYGRILFLLASQGHFTLHQLSKYLFESDLELNIALNLDGGVSTGLLLAEPALMVPVFAELPIVIRVYAR